MLYVWEIARETERQGQYLATSNTPHCSWLFVQFPLLGRSQSEKSLERKT